MLFEEDAYAQDVQVGLCPWPKTAEQQNELFNRFGAKLRRSFEYARSLGIKTCVGTEVPLTVPKEVRERIVTGRTTTQPTGDDVQKLSEQARAQQIASLPAARAVPRRPEMGQQQEGEGGRRHTSSSISWSPLPPVSFRNTDVR